MDFEKDTKVLNISDQYMFGCNLMICPVDQYKARTREVYFPESAGWYNIYDGKFYSGGNKQTVSAPYGRMPVFVSAGRNGTFTLYEDENINYNYEKGSFSTIQFTYNNQDKSLSIGERKGHFTGMVKGRNFHFILVDQNKPVGMDNTLQDLKTVHYTGAKTPITL